MGNPEAELFENTANLLEALRSLSGYFPEARRVLRHLNISPDELEALYKRHYALARFMYLTGETPQPEATFRPIEDDDDHMTMADFIDSCECGAFIDYDGHGVYATATEKTDLTVVPSDVSLCKLDPRWTHVVWYNR